MTVKEGPRVGRWILRAPAGYTQANLIHTKFSSSMGRITITNMQIKPDYTPRFSNASYEVVLRSVPKDATPEDIEAALREAKLNFKSTRRIISWATKEPTTLVRVFTPEPDTVHKLLTNGLLATTSDVAPNHPGLSQLHPPNAADAFH